LEISWLEDFLALCETGNFSRAAERRHLTQPAFSRRIRALEDWVGAPLFDRAAHPITPTPAGEQLRPAAEAILARLFQAREQARNAAAGRAATLRFAATHSLSLTFFPAWIRSLETAGEPHPIRLESDNMTACRQLLVQGQCEFLLCHADPAAPDRLDPQAFRSLTVGRDVLVPTTRPDTGLRLPGTAEAPLPWFAYSEASALGQAVETRLRATTRPAYLDRVFTSHLAIVLRSMVRDRDGIAWLPRTLIAEDLAAGRLVPADGEDWTIPLDVRVFRPRERLSDAAEAFWELLTAMAA